MRRSLLSDTAGVLVLDVIILIGCKSQDYINVLLMMLYGFYSNRDLCPHHLVKNGALVDMVTFSVVI